MMEVSGEIRQYREEQRGELREKKSRVLAEIEKIKQEAVQVSGVLRAEGGFAKRLLDAERELAEIEGRLDVGHEDKRWDE
jgi:hypothetical protein